MIENSIPLISVIVATYNGKLYLKEQLNSVLAQTYPNFEVIIVDDCSADETIEVARKVINHAGFTRSSIFINTENIGINKTFQRGIEQSRGDYIAFCDQDDIWETHKLETLYDALQSAKSEVVFAPSRKMRPNGQLGGILIRPEISSNPFKRLLNNRARGASVLLTRSYIDRLLPFPDKGLYDKWILFHALAEENVTTLREPLDRYRIHAANVVGTRFKFRSKTSLLEKLINEADFYRKLGKSLGFENKSFPVIQELISFHDLLAGTLIRRNFLQSLIAYFRYVVKNGLVIKENLTYFYYLFIK